MGKKSLTKSTTKKKATTKKKTTKKKAASASPKKTAAKSKSKKPTLKSLRKKQFDQWSPESLYVPPKEGELEKQFSAPAVTDDFDKKTAKNISALLLKQFELSGGKADSKPKKKAAAKAAPKKAEKKQKAAPKEKKAEEKPKKAAAKKKPEPKTEAKEPAKPRKPVSVKELLSMKFDAWTPETLYKPETDASRATNFTAPPLTEDYDAAAADKIRSLLGKEFDLSIADVPESPAPAQPEADAMAEPEAKSSGATETEKTEPEAEAEKTTEPQTAAKEPAKPRKPVSVKELLSMKFDAWTPETLYKPETDAGRATNFTAPPLTEDYDAAAADKIRSLLGKEFDLSIPDVPEPPAPAQPEPEAIAEPEAEDTGAAEAEKTESEAEVEKTAEPVAETPQPDTPSVQADKASAAEPVAEDKPINAEKPEKAEKPDKLPEKQKAEPPKKEAPKKPSGGDGPQEPPEPPKPPVAEKKEPMDRGLMMLIGGVALIFVLIVGASINNMQEYYITQTDEALEIWRGDFSPRGKHKIATLPALEMPVPPQDVYTRKEALTPVFNHYMDKADALTEARDLLDFKAIKNYLHQAEEFAATDAQQQMVQQRLNRIDYLMLLYKADVASRKNTAEGLKKAKGLLKEATALNNDPEQQQVVEKRIGEITESLEALEAKSEKPAVKAAPKAETKTTEKPEAKTAEKPEVKTLKPDPEETAAEPEAEKATEAAESSTKAAPKEKSADTPAESEDNNAPETPSKGEKSETTYH